tara:strand:+ start:157 stop:687 length:531 start_codon:yes stop_codon:yes gene_type:complete
MKRFFVFIILSLLLCGNAYSATKYTYLSCKAIIAKNESKSKEFSSAGHLKIGSNNGHYFYKFKDNKKKSKLWIYDQGTLVQPNWKTMKPKAYIEGGKWDVFNKKDHAYTFVDRVTSGANVLTAGFVIQKINDEYLNTTTFTWDKDGQNQIDLVTDQKCSVVNKKDLKLFLKNGVQY